MRPQPIASDAASCDTAPRPHSARTRGSRAVALGLGLSVLVTVAGCGNGSNQTPAASSPATTSTSASASASRTTNASGARSPSTSGSASQKPAVAEPPAKPTTRTPAASCVDRVYNAMSDAQRVGQLFMTGVSSAGMTAAESAAITQGKAGSVILTGHTAAGVGAVKAVTNRVRTLTQSVGGATVGLLVATDQEGGQVQVLNGPGFSAMPDAVTQGVWPPATLLGSATTWGQQLRAAGVNMNLAPVADTVPPDLVNVNAPIGLLHREYGTDPATVASHSTAFLQGMLKAGVVTTAKHFPGLGRVRGNTDVTAGVTDTVTTADDPYLQPFRAAVQAGTPFVMVSSAIYTRIDASRQAAFSPVVIRGVLRGSLGFKGAIISDDFGNAVAVSDRTPAQRALDFLSAGGNMVLTVRPSDIATMTGAVLSRLPHDSALRNDVADSAHRVLTAKQNAGVLSCR